MLKVRDRPTFGKLLREFRLAAGLSQEALAERARLSVDGIGALERGVNKAPQRETLSLLIEALQLEPQQRGEIEAAALPASRTSAPSVSRATLRHNLPRLHTPLFGRERDLTKVLEVVSQSVVVTLTGAGGVGKTRLAIEAGFLALQHFAQGVWFVDLARVRDADGVPAIIAAMFGVRERTDVSRLDATVEALANRNLLLILDNCEHLATAAAAAVEAIAAGCAGVHVLATSRQPLHVSGEQTCRVASLDPRASANLFMDAAQRADASFTVDEAEMPTVQRIVQRLDGIALAIELAASRVKLLSLAQIEELLGERLRVLTGAGRLVRHRTMRAVVDWSYDLLSGGERTVFDRLGTFAADFSFEAAAAICAEAIDKPKMLEVLGSLVDKSLLTSERHGRSRRFRLLETMRAYALEKLGAQIEALRRRHADYYAALAQVLERDTTVLASTFELEYENFQQALDWLIDEAGDAALGIRLLVALREFLLFRGLAAESARRAERVLQGAATLPPELAAMAWITLAMLRGDLLLPAKAFDAVNRALELYEQLENNAGVALALRSRGIAYLRLGKPAEAEHDLKQALELTKVYGSRRDLVRTLGSVALSHEMNGRLEEARTATLEVLDMALADGDERIIWVSKMNLAETEFDLGETASAASRLEELLASRMARKNLRMRANAKSNLAAYLIALRREDEARTVARAAVFEGRDAGDTGVMLCALGHLAAILAKNDPRDAARLLGYVERVFAEGYRRENTERYTHGVLTATLQNRLIEIEIASLAREGAAMSEAQAIRLATRPR